jgi:glutathione S-transferase
MIILHGFPFSNYYNIVKHALMIKGLPFEEHKIYTSDPELLQLSPAGKVPAMTTEHGTLLSESSVLLDYLEDAYPEVPLYPADADARAQVRQLMKISELYLELPARQLLPAVLGNLRVSEDSRQEVSAVLKRGARALNTLASFSPWLYGAEMTLADIYLRYALAIPKLVGPGHLHWNIFEQVPGLAAWDALMAQSDIAAKIDADQAANAGEFMARLAADS